MKRILLSSAVALTAIASSAFAAELPSLLTDMETKGYFKIVGSTQVKEVEDVTAVMVEDNSEGNFHVYWVDDSQGTIFTGDLVTVDGVNLSNTYRNKLVPSQADTFNKVFDKGLVLGDTDVDVNTDNALYVFYEPFCTFCRKLHKNMQPLIEKGLNVQYIPVAWIRPNSADVIATIAKSDDITKALYMSDANILEVTETADDQTRTQIEFNGFVMRSMGISGTPGMVYKTGDGKVIVARNYSQSQLDDLYNELMSRNK
ncbi:thioredoxin fold domain-containing protein [Vibrio sp. Makdt]|uniref:thioredoxin fold domain-containing protein n=1 Tax=Vibrio sp. Makdt TaxID=2998828 RepID=UPI0022CD35E0|nr:thioredoxin fold domain-containing protein [Vibrio sp. Makdt]MDA0152419.1 thioredoxin fold domain-containing protein [Vibrio sp. Makdt]